MDEAWRPSELVIDGDRLAYYSYEGWFVQHCDMIDLFLSDLIKGKLS
jgi:hypothetical protein